MSMKGVAQFKVYVLYWIDCFNCVYYVPDLFETISFHCLTLNFKYLCLCDRCKQMHVRVVALLPIQWLIVTFCETKELKKGLWGKDVWFQKNKTNSFLCIKLDGQERKFQFYIGHSGMNCMHSIEPEFPVRVNRVVNSVDC